MTIDVFFPSLKAAVECCKAIGKLRVGGVQATALHGMSASACADVYFGGQVALRGTMEGMGSNLERDGQAFSGTRLKRSDEGAVELVLPKTFALEASAMAKADTIMSADANRGATRSAGLGSNYSSAIAKGLNILVVIGYWIQNLGLKSLLARWTLAAESGISFFGNLLGAMSLKAETVQLGGDLESGFCIEAVADGFGRLVKI